MSEPSVKDFWDEQATLHGESDLATAPDHYYRELEISRIIPHLTDSATILDVGCGNGYSTFKFAEANPKSRIIGLDYSDEMIRLANVGLKQRPTLKRLSFQTGDVLHLPDMDNTKFDIILSERCLINLANFEEQKKAVLQMKRKLNPGGKLILVENTIEGLNNLNKLRTQFNLHTIKVRWHNSYLPQREFLEFARHHFRVQHTENIGNLYYLISRVVYAKLAEMQGIAPSYDNPINAIAAQLPSLPAYSYSPNMMFILKENT